VRKHRALLVDLNNRAPTGRSLAASRTGLRGLPLASLPHTGGAGDDRAGLQLGRCLFCSDVETVNGRTFRSRPVEAVLDEISQQSARHAAKQVAFLDIKLNGDLAMWRGVADGFQRHLPGGTWVGTVHVQSRGDNGLSRDDLQAAYDSGMRRISCGLETGSQRVNDSMAKGTQLAQTSEFIRDAHAVGLSVRATMMLG